MAAIDVVLGVPGITKLSCATPLASPGAMRHASCLNMSGECAGRGDRGDGYREVSRWRVLELWTTRVAVSRLGLAIACLAIAGESAATRVAFPVFTLMVPPETPAELIGGGLPQYPPLPRMAGAIAIVTTEFFVDSAGRAMPSTFKEIWGPKDKRPTGKLLEYYDAFVSSIKRWLPSATFAPARVGGCPVPQLVSQPFTFTIGQ